MARDKIGSLLHIFRDGAIVIWAGGLPAGAIYAFCRIYLNMVAEISESSIEDRGANPSSQRARIMMSPSISYIRLVVLGELDVWTVMCVRSSFRKGTGSYRSRVVD